MIAIILFCPVFIEYLETGLVPNFPTLIVSGFVTIASIISWFSGLILSAMSLKEQRDFEFKLLLVDELYRQKENRSGE